MRRVGLLGGTFDPVHFGHLRSAVEVCEQLQLDELRLIPSARPPHRGMPGATAAQRLRMVELALGQGGGLRMLADGSVRRVGDAGRALEVLYSDDCYVVRVPLKLLLARSGAPTRAGSGQAVVKPAGWALEGGAQGSDGVEALLPALQAQLRAAGEPDSLRSVALLPVEQGSSGVVLL